MFGDALVLFNSFWKVDIDASSDDISASNDTGTTMSSTQDPIFIQNGTSTSEIRFSNHYQVMIEKGKQTNFLLTNEIQTYAKRFGEEILPFRL